MKEYYQGIFYTGYQVNEKLHGLLIDSWYITQFSIFYKTKGIYDMEREKILNL